MNKDEYGLENFDDDLDSNHGHRDPPPRWFIILAIIALIVIILILIKIF